MKTTLISVSAFALMLAGSVAHADGGRGFYNPSNEADLDLDYGGGGDTNCSGRCQVFADAEEEADGYTNSSPRAQGTLKVRVDTGGRGFLRNGTLYINSDADADGEIVADASRRPTTASAEFDGEINSAGGGDKVNGSQRLTGAIFAEAVDTSRYDDADAGAGVAARQRMQASSTGRDEAAAGVAGRISLSVDKEEDDGLF